MKMIKLFLALFFANSLVAEDLIVGTSVDNVPFEYIQMDFLDGTIKYSGFEMDLLDEVMKRSGYTYTIEKFDHNELIPALKAKKINLIANSMNITPEHEALLDFTVPFFIVNHSFLKRTDDTTIKTKDDLNGKTICVQKGSLQEVDAKNIPNAKILASSNYTDLVKNLNEKTADVIMIESSVAHVITSENNNTTEFYKEPDMSLGIAFALDKNSTGDILPKIDNAIGDIINDGTFDKLLEKHKMQL